jgi:hypothetical protein
MKELVDALVKNLKVDARQAEGGAAVLFKAARDKMGQDAFGKALGKVPGIEALIAKAPDSGGLGKLFGGFASAVGGGNAAIIASILSGFGKLGLNQEHAKSFVPVILDFLRTKVGKDSVDKIEKTLRT